MHCVCCKQDKRKADQEPGGGTYLDMCTGEGSLAYQTYMGKRYVIPLSYGDGETACLQDIVGPYKHMWSKLCYTYFILRLSLKNIISVFLD